jgi:uncharacterized protein YukE
MAKPIFDEMLAVYPPEKRELARAAFNRFVDGDSTQFFTQLCLLLDVYANYTSRIPQAVKQANDETQAALNEIRDEIGSLAKDIQKRGVNLSNATEETTARCLETQKKCEAAAERMAKITKEIGRQVDVTGVIESIRKSVDAGVNAKVIKPLMERTDELSEKVLPTLESIQSATEQAARVWPTRIWEMALTCGAVLGLAIAILVSSVAWLEIRHHYNRILADQIVSAAGTLEQNRAAFQLLAAANVPIRVIHSSDANGEQIPANYVLMIEGAQAAEMRQNIGCIFFNSPRQETEIEERMHETEERLDQLEKLAHEKQ